MNYLKKKNGFGPRHIDGVLSSDIQQNYLKSRPILSPKNFFSKLPYCPNLKQNLFGC